MCDDPVCSVTVAGVGEALRGGSTVLRDKESVVNHCLGRTRGRKQVGRDGGVGSDQGQGRSDAAGSYVRGEERRGSYSVVTYATVSGFKSSAGCFLYSCYFTARRKPITNA